MITPRSGLGDFLMDKTLDKLLTTQKKYIGLVNKIDELYQSVTNNNGSSALDLDELILDYLGFPIENSVDTESDDPDYFCRDWLTDIIYDYCDGVISLEETITKLKAEKANLSSEGTPATSPSL